ncbi:MAG: ATP-binding protein [Flavobacteriales bacterium]|jgi:signal transduction histidine kinase|nr:ATP-binding protein [Flavobacteriales bacterium]
MLFIITLIETILLCVILFRFEKNRFNFIHRFVLKSEQYHAILQNTFLVQEEERIRIAGNIHDNLIGQLYRIKLLNKDKRLSKLLNQSIQTARHISHDLSPPLIERLAFQDIVYDYVSPIQEELNIQLHFLVIDHTILSNYSKLNLYRILQELITNCIKHAQADMLYIQYRVSRQYICLRVEDNGVGFKSTEKKGAGLQNIEVRSQLLRGSYRMVSTVNKGTKFLLVLKKSNDER